MTEESSETTSNTTLVLGFLSICATVLAIFMAVELVTQPSRDEPPPVISFDVDDPDAYFHYFENVERRLLKSTKSTRTIPQEKRQMVFVTQGDHSEPLNRDFVYVTNLDERYGHGQHLAHRLRVEEALTTLDVEIEVQKQQAQQLRMPRASQGLSEEQIDSYVDQMESIEIDPKYFPPDLDPLPGQTAGPGQIPELRE